MPLNKVSRALVMYLKQNGFICYSLRTGFPLFYLPFFMWITSICYLEWDTNHGSLCIQRSYNGCMHPLILKSVDLSVKDHIYLEYTFFFLTSCLTCVSYLTTILNKKKASILIKEKNNFVRWALQLWFVCLLLFFDFVFFSHLTMYSFVQVKCEYQI